MKKEDIELQALLGLRQTYSEYGDIASLQATNSLIEKYARKNGLDYYSL